MPVLPAWRVSGLRHPFQRKGHVLLRVCTQDAFKVYLQSTECCSLSPEMHSIIVTRCGIIHSINVRTVTAKLALETEPPGQGKHTIFGLGHFQILLKPGSCIWLYAHTRCSKTGEKGWNRKAESWISG